MREGRHCLEEVIVAEVIVVEVIVAGVIVAEVIIASYYRGEVTITSHRSATPCLLQSRKVVAWENESRQLIEQTLSLRGCCRPVVAA